MRKFTIIVLMKQISTVQYMFIPIRRRGHPSGAEPVGRRERAPQPLLFNGRSIVLGPAAIRLEPVVALLNSLITTAT
jgi:hypothetical protein